MFTVDECARELVRRDFTKDERNYANITRVKGRKKLDEVKLNYVRNCVFLIHRKSAASMEIDWVFINNR